MRILHIYKDYFPIVGGIENHVKILAEGQAARGHEVTVLVTSRTRSEHLEVLNGVRVIFASRWFNLSSAPISPDLARWVVREHPDITHLHFPYPVGEAANYFFGHSRVTILTYHSDIVRQKTMTKFYAPIMSRILNRVDSIIATSPNYIASSPVLARHADKCIVVPLGIDPIPFLTQKQPTAYAKKNGLELLFVGRLRYYKGLDYLLRAMKNLPTSHLVIVGIGPMEQQWKELAQQLGIAARVNWAGEVQDALLPQYYASCDIFVLPASERSEAFGAVQLEAMAAGKPVVSCDVGTGVAWVNRNEETGLVVPPRDSVALSKAILRLAGDEQQRELMGSRGRARVQSEFTSDLMVERVLSLYAKLSQPLAK